MELKDLTALGITEEQANRVHGSKAAAAVTKFSSAK